jgi:hypothetical protein
VIALMEWNGSSYVVRDYQTMPGTTNVGNVTTPGVRKPDLMVTRIQLEPKRMMTGQLIRAKITVRNRGNARSGGGILEVWRDQSSSPAPTSTGDGRVLIGALNPGQSRTLNFTLRENVRAPDAIGNYIFRARVDNQNVIAESNEANNERALLYQVVNLNIAQNNSWYRVSAQKTGVRYFEFFVPRGTNRVHFLTRPAVNPVPGSGNPNLYIKRGSGAYPGDFHRASLKPGPWERVTIPNPAPGRYFVTTYGQDTFQHILLRMWRE